jgi:hypothetical protein
MLEYELNGKTYTEDDLINMAGGKDKLPAYIKSKGFKPKNKKATQPTKFYEKPSENLYKQVFGFENPAKEDYSEINKTKKKVTPKKFAGPITPEMIKGEESTAAANLSQTLARYGLTPEETGFGINRITIRNDKKAPLGKRLDQYGNEIEIDLDPVVTGVDLSPKELAESAKRLNDYIRLYGDKDYAKRTKKENPNLVSKYSSVIDAPRRTREEKLKLHNAGLEDEFKQKETIVKNRLGIKGGWEPRADIQLTKNDFDTPEKYNDYKTWKKTGQIALPSEQKLEKFIGEYNNAYRARKSSEFMSDAPPEQRVMISALASEKEDESVKTAEFLKTKSKELDQKSKDYSLKIAKFEKTPPTALELAEARKEYLALQNEIADYNKKALSTKKDFNTIKAVYDTALKDYSRLNQTGTLLKQTGLGIAGGIVDLLTTNPYSVKTSLLKRSLLDPIYSEQKAASKELESYQQNLQIKDIKSMKDLGRWGAGVLTQMPSSIAMAVTGEAALPLFFLSGYGSKQYEIASAQEEALGRLQYYTEQLDNGLVAQEDMADVQKQIASDKKTLSISEGQKLTSQLLAGTAEVLFEKYGTLGIIKETDNILRSIPPQEIKRQLKVIGKEMGKSAGVEAWTEGLTQLANNFGDIHLLGQDKNYFDGVPDSMAGGAFMGPGFSAMGGSATLGNNITKAVVGELASKEEFKARNRKLAEIKKLTGLTDITGLTKAELNDLALQPPIKKAVEELIDQIDGEDLRILDRLGKDFSMEDAKKVGDLNQKLRKITKDWNEASKTVGIEDAQLKSLKDYYQKQYNEVFNEREAMLTDTQLAGKNKKDNALKRITFEATAGSTLYNYRLTRKTYLEKLNAFEELSSDDKQKYKDIALAEINLNDPQTTLSDKEINSKARELYAGEEINKQLDRDIQAANDFSSESGLNVKVEAINSEKELLEKYGNTLTASQLKAIKDGEINAFNIDDTTLAVYKPNAIKNGHTSSGSHEVLHTVLSKAFKGNQEEANKNGIKLLEYLKTAQPDLYAAVEERMRAYDTTDDAYGEEVFNALSDSFSDGKVPNENVFVQISKAINKITKGAFGTSSTFDINNINTDSGRALFDTVKAYHQKASAKKTKTGQNIRFIYSDTEDKSAEEPTITGFRASKTKVAEIQKKIDNLEDQLDNGEIDYDDYEDRLKIFEKELAKAKAAPEEAPKPEAKKVEITDEEADKEIVKNERGSVSSDKVQKIYDEKGLNGAQDIIDLFKPITKKLVNRRMDAPGFDRELLTDEIETGTGGILDLITKYKPDSGVPLAAFINKYLPVRAIAASRRVLDKDFSKDVTEEKGLMAEETVSEAKEKPKYKNALESNVFEPEVLKTLSDKIITVTRTLKNRIDAPITLNRTVTPLISEIRDEVGRLLDIDVKTAMGGKKDDQLKKWLLKNKRYVLENMTTTWLMGKDGVGGMPQAIQKQIDGKWVSYPDWVGKKIDREKTTTDQAGRTSGAELVRRLPNVNNNVSNEVYLAQVLEPSGNPIRGRKESLAKAVAEESAFDIINADLESQGPIYEAFTANQERLGYEIAANTVNEFVRQSERGNIKFSKTYNNFNEKQKELFNRKISELSAELNPFLNNVNRDLSINLAFNKVFKNLLINNKPAFTADDIANLAKDFRPWLRQMRDIDKANERFLEDENFDFNKFLKNIAELNEYIPLEVLGMPGVEQKLFTAANVNNARKTSKAMMSHWNETFGSEEAMKMALYLTLTFSGNTSLGNSIGLDVDKNGIVFETNTRGKRSGQIAKNSKDYWDNIVFPSFNNLNNKEKAKLKEKVRLETLAKRRRDSASRAYKDKDWEIRKNEAEYHQKIVQRIFEFYFDKNNNIPDTDKAIMVRQMGSNMQSVMKKSAILTYEFVKNKKDENVGPLRYEHTRPANKVSGDIIRAYMEADGRPSGETLEAIWKTYEASLIPVSMDDNFRAILLETNMNPGWKAGDPVYYRYYNYATFGKPNMYPIANVFTGEIIGEKFVEASNAMINGVENGKKIDAVTNSLTVRYSKTPKGISVFDFDDTVGLTKSNVLYTKPDETTIYHGGTIKGLKDISGPLYVATDKAQAEEYSKGHKGAVKSFVIKTDEIVDEDVVIDEINALGLKSKDKNYEVDELNLYELIDPNFDTSLSDKDLNTLFNSLKQKGIKAVEFLDMNLTTLKNDIYNIVILDKNIVQEQGKLTGEEFAKEGTRLLEEGAVFDFSEFSKVVDGKPGPMVEKMKKMISKFGPENFFILTARPANAAEPIHEFLTSIGIDIPLENITGLGNSAAQAKADWMVAKAAEGYNDFYFADDAPQNVKAVQDALDALDVKSKVQQAKIKFSLNSRQDLNWEEAGDSKFTTFKVKGKEYSLLLTDTGYFNWGGRIEATLNTLINKYELDEPALLGSYEGETLNLVFSDENDSIDITGAGNAAEVFGTVINGVIDYANANNTDNFIFTAKEPSRIKLYNAIASTIANKLKWNVFSKNGVYIISKYPAGRGILPFENQSQAVQNVLNVVDIKSPRQQGKIKFSKTMSARFNEIIEENKGVESYKVFSDITARRRGLKKNRFDFYVPPSAADFELLLYKFMGKGALGEEQKKFFEDALLKPYINGVNLMDAVRQSIKREYKTLLKSFPEIKKELEKLTPNKDFTYDQAIRVAIWNQFGIEIPGLSKRDQIYLSDLVNNDPDLAAFKDGLIVMGRQKDGWLPPSTYWDADTIVSDLYNITEGSGRKKFLGEFIENTEELFGTWSEGRLVGPNMNKIEAVYGTNVREALEDSIYRMINGKNRSYGQDKETTAWNSWVNGSTGSIMFLNTRSAALQMLGAVNFLNWRDNNPYNAGKAFLNQPQYWKDFARIWNSDKLKERRGGLREDVASAEIANAAAGSKNKVVAITSYLLKIGYTPTQIADSFAIASGGAPFYRNRIKSYLKEGLTEQEAEAKAWQDFSKISDETQQSGDPKDISKQQSSAAGRILLVFQNFTMQQSRIVKKAVLDLKNGRGDAKTNIAKIAYYLAVQNIMFSTLQQGLFAAFFDDDEEEDKKKKTKSEAAYDVANGVLDSILRGTGFIGGITATLKNTIVKYIEEAEKKQKAEYAKVVLEFANMSPPIGSKLRKTYSALQQTKYDKDLIKERGWGVMQDGRVHLGPMYSVSGKLVEVGTNFPMDRLVNKVENISQAFNSDNTAVQRIATGLGYSPWTVGIEGTKGDLKIKAEAKERRKEEGIIKAKQTRKENAERLKDSIKGLSPEEQRSYRRGKALERREKRVQKASEKREERRKKMEMFRKLNANK